MRDYWNRGFSRRHRRVPDACPRVEAAADTVRSDLDDGQPVSRETASVAAPLGEVLSDDPGTKKGRPRHLEGGAIDNARWQRQFYKGRKFNARKP